MRQHWNRKSENVWDFRETRRLRYRIIRKSIDARKKPELSLVYSVEVSTSGRRENHKKGKRSECYDRKADRLSSARGGFANAVHPAGDCRCGSCGTFCAYALTMSGCAPVVLERGRSVTERTKDVERFWESGVLDTVSNVQFGEGGAGTFSDGKLNTLVKDPTGRNRFVLETFGNSERRSRFCTKTNRTSERIFLPESSKTCGRRWKRAAPGFALRVV